MAASSVLVALSASPAFAGELVYTPVNPVFGGSPLNSTTVLGIASANNRFTQNPATRQTPQATDPVSQFRNQITASLLSQIASNIGQQIIGENARDSGTFNLNGTVVDFKRVGGQINIDITDGPSGAKTNIQIPVPNF